MDRKHVFADKLELVTRFVLHKNGVIASTVARHLVSRGHERRRGRRQAHEALHRPRHVRHPRRHQQPALGPRRLDLRHARLQRRRGHVARRHEDLRPRRQRRGALQAGRQRLRAVQQPQRQHLGSRHHVGRPGVLDAADERHRVLPHRAAGVRAREGQAPGHDVVEGHDHRPDDLPAHVAARAGLRADRSGRPLHRRRRLRDLRGRRLARASGTTATSPANRRSTSCTTSS